LGGREFFRQGDGDTAGACANVDDGEIFSGELGWTAGADFADSEAIEGDFEEMFGFGARDEGVRSDLEVETPEFLMAGEVLGGFAGGAAADQGEVSFSSLRVQEFFGVGVEPGAIATGNVEEEDLGGEGVGGDVGFAEKMDALFEDGADGADVKSFGL
jgi:hypothetical protein